MKFLTLLAVTCWCFLSGGQTMHLIRPRPMPLDSSVTWNDLSMMSQHAQRRDTDHETRLLPVFSKNMLQEGDTCCIISHILEYYLKHILDISEHFDKKYPQISFVRSDLQRIGMDLGPHCGSSSFAEHVLVKKFERNYMTCAQNNLADAHNKAVGEAIILFHYLFESCNPGI